MTIPLVAARTTTASTTTARSHSIALGSPNAGDMLVVVAAATGSTVAPFLIDENVSGKLWTPIGAGAVGSNLRIAVYAKLAVGGGGDALTLVTGAGRLAAHCYRVTGHGSAIAGGSTATASSTNGNPPAASITGAAQDTLFLTAMTTLSSVASAAPASYSTLTTTNATSVFMSSAERGISATTSDDPGTFTNTSQEWIATTVAIPELVIATNARASQAVREILSNETPALRASQIAREIASAAAPNLRATQICVEMASENVPNDSAGGEPGMLLIAT